MSSRLTYANGAAVLTDFVLDCWNCLPSKFDTSGAAITADEAAIDFIAAWVCGLDCAEDEVKGRGSIDGLCRAYGLNWPVLAGWIRRDAKRDSLFRQALADRGAIRKERLLDGWWMTAQIPVPETQATHGDVHKAREALAKSEGVFSDAAKVQIDNHVTIIHESA